jgi:hypothetical protein
VEPPIGIEPMTYALRGRSDVSTSSAILWLTRVDALDVSRPYWSVLVVLRTCADLYLSKPSQLTLRTK